MKLKKELNLAAGFFSEKQIFLLFDILLLSGHIIYVIIFHMLGVRQMERYNYFSVTFYLIMLYFLHKKNNSAPFLYATLVEVTIHSCLGAYYLGWIAGFTQMLLCIIPVPFYINPNEKKLPYLLSSLDVLIFISMRIYMTDKTFPYSFSSGKTNIVFIYNTICSFVLIIYISSIYIFTNEKNRREAKAQNENLQRLATIDPLTELFNRRAMMDFIKVIQANARKANKEYVLCLGDIDDFKHVNDSYGHDAGDKVLKTVSQIIAQTVPAEGYVCRWGGEEILFVVPFAGKEDGVRIAQDICTRISSSVFDVGGGSFSISMTFGVYSVKPDENYDSGISKADKLLYKGKSHGKNCVVSE